MAQNDPRLDKLGFNHICFAVKNAEEMVHHLKSKGVEVRSELKDFHSRQLFFYYWPGGDYGRAGGVGLSAPLIPRIAAFFPVFSRLSGHPATPNRPAQDASHR